MLFCVINPPLKYCIHLPLRRDRRHLALDDRTWPYISHPPHPLVVKHRIVCVAMQCEHEVSPYGGPAVHMGTAGRHKINNCRRWMDFMWTGRMDFFLVLLRKTEGLTWRDGATLALCLYIGSSVLCFIYLNCHILNRAILKYIELNLWKGLWHQNASWDFFVGGTLPFWENLLIQTLFCHVTVADTATLLCNTTMSPIMTNNFTMN